MADKYVLLKQSYPTSTKDRICDGYKYIIENTTKEERLDHDIIDEELQKEIKKGEKYLYRVGKENDVFKTMYISLKNFEIIRKKYFLFED